MTNFNKLFALAAVALTSLVLPACSTNDSSVGGSSNGLGGAECKPGDKKTAADGCNTCTCQQNGFFACTEMACGTPTTCKAGETKKADDGCNTCSCDDKGQWACTLLGCVAGCKTDSECPAPKGPCLDCPGGGCATAVCNAGVCEIREPTCPAPTCKAGDKKVAEDGCNTCTCDDKGQWACTEIGCVAQCKSDADCPATPPFCNTCPDGSQVCPSNACIAGTCQLINNTCPSTVEPGGACEKPGAEAPAADGCNTCICGDSLTWACTKIACIECDGPQPPCAPPPAGCDYVGGGCVDGQWTCGQLTCGVECDGPQPPCAPPPEGCDYVGGGCVDGQWTCGQLTCGAQCKVNSDCPVSDGPCLVCPDGTSHCPEASCNDGVCVQSVQPCEATPCSAQEAKGSGACELFLGFAWDGSSCVGLSGCSCVGADCGKLYASPDLCKVDHQGCGSGSQCQSSSDCAQPGSPCHSAICNAGVCELVAVPGCGSGTCEADSDCPQPDCPCVKCLGNNSCAKAICDMGACVTLEPMCGDSCVAQDAKGVGECAAFFGYAWNGSSCVGLGGCSCEGADCGNLYATPAICQGYHSNCQ